jgi:predicted nucleic acid-binding protein
MRYWDSSALVPLIVQEPRSEEMRSLARDDIHIITTAYTTVEIASAVWRRRHHDELSMAEHEAAERNFADLSATWIEVPVEQDVLNAAISVLSRHTLRAGDALQLGAAQIVAGQQASLTFVTLDEDLANAARNEGFPVLP